MRKAILLLILAPPLFATASDYKCAVVGGALEQSLFDAVVHDININGNDIIRAKTTVQVLNVSPVSKIFAQQLAKADSDADKKRNGTPLLQESDYFESYAINGAKSITVKYTLRNTKGQRSSFIASGLVNNDECSVRFNGYLTLSREF